MSTFARDPSCDACRRITSGDCGRHGPLTLAATPSPAIPDHTFTAPDGSVHCRCGLAAAQKFRDDAIPEAGLAERVCPTCGLPRWPGREDFMRMRPEQINAFFAAKGIDWRVVADDPDDGHEHWFACVRCGVDHGLNDAIPEAGLAGRVLRLTGEQLASIEPPVSEDWFIDFDEYEDFVVAIPETGLDRERLGRALAWIVQTRRGTLVDEPGQIAAEYERLRAEPAE